MRICKSSKINFGQRQNLGWIPPQRNVEFPADHERFNQGRLTVLLQNVSNPVTQGSSRGHHCLWANSEACILCHWLDN
jgi:hypothetical protein